MRYRSIALSGGGVKGGAYIGALRAIQEVQGSLEFPDGVYGSSVGAIVGGLVAFNVSPERIEEVVVKHCRVSRWLPTPSVTDVLTIRSRKGVFSMAALRAMIVDLYTDAGIESVETLTVGSAPQPFFVVASDMTARRPTLLTGNVPLLQALLCSCCIPGLFEPQHLYGHVYLDAAVYVRRIETIAPREALILQLVPQGEPITTESSIGEILHACYVGYTVGRPNANVCAFTNLTVGVFSSVGETEREELFGQGYSQVLAFLAKMAAKKG
jgi:NTE family protein